MSNLSKYTIDELEAELERRELLGDMPKLLANPDFSNLQRVCSEYLESIARDEVDDDHDHWIYEAAMEACFGRNIWGFINGVLK